MSFWVAAWPTARVLIEQFYSAEHEALLFMHINLGAVVLLSTPPPPSGHLASLTLALAWPTFLGFIHQEKNRTLTGIPLKAHRSQRHWDRQYTVQINTNVASSQTTVNFVTMSTAVTVLWANTSCHTITVSLFIKWCPLSAPDEGAWVIVRSYMTYQFLQK